MKFKKQYKSAIVIKQFKGNFTDGDFESIELILKKDDKVEIFHCCRACQDYPIFHIKIGSFEILKGIKKEEFKRHFKLIP